MKKILPLLIFIFIISFFDNSDAQVNGQFKWVHPKPQGNFLRWVKRFDANNWYAVGYGGTFLKTNNVGSSWTVTHNVVGTTSAGYNIALYDAHFFDLNTGLVCGSYGKISRTTNAGTSWNIMTIGSSTWYDLYFLNSSTGFIAGTSSNKVYKTTNGGLNWTSIGLTLTSTSYSIYAWDVNNIIVSSSSGNVVKTTNGGTTWTTINTGTTATLYKINFMDNNIGFVCGTTGVIRLSPNGGTSWIDVSSGTSTSTKYDIDFGPPEPEDGDRYLTQKNSTTSVSSPLSIKLTEDFEATTWPPTGWTETGTTSIWGRSTAASGYGTGVASARAYFYGVSSGTGILTTVAFSPTSAGDSVKFDHAYATYVSEVDRLQIWYSTNGGSSYTSLITLNGGVSGPLVTAPPQTSNFVPTASQWATKTYALPVGTNRLRFNGITAYGNNLYIDNIQVGAAGPFNSVYVTGDAAFIYKSTNLGTTWSTVEFRPAGGQPVSSTMYSTDLAPSGDALITGGAYGLFNERFNASTRIQYCNRLTTSTAYDVWGENGYGKVISVGSSGTVLTSVNGGNTWTRTIYSTSTWNSISMINSNTGWIAGSSGRTYRTVNGGATFSEVTNNTTATLYKVFFANANTGWIFGSSGTIRRTTNAGSTWITQTAPGVTGVIRGAHFVDEYTGWLCGDGGIVSNTNDGGEMWTAQNSNTNATLYDIDMLNASTGWMCGSSSTFRKTVNGGTTWSTLTIPYTGVTLWGVDFVDQNNGMVVGTNGMTFRTRNGGSSWQFENNSGVTNTNVYLTSSDTGYVCGSYSNIFKYQEFLTGVSNYTNEIPETYELHQNYPNPFNPTTTIKFGLPENSSVTLKVYDITGRIIKTLFNNEGLSAGTFKYTFDGSNLSSGMYFYSLVVDGNQIETKKMILIK